MPPRRRRYRAGVGDASEFDEFVTATTTAAQITAATARTPADLSSFVAGPRELSEASTVTSDAADAVDITLVRSRRRRTASHTDSEIIPLTTAVAAVDVALTVTATEVLAEARDDMCEECADNVAAAVDASQSAPLYRPAPVRMRSSAVAPIEKRIQSAFAAADLAPLHVSPSASASDCDAKEFALWRQREARRVRTSAVV